MGPFDQLLEESVKLHGHLCPGQVLGVRLAMLGCRAVRLEEPREGKRLLVFVEIDRCATDAIQSVTGCSLGKRTLRHVDYGKTAATFVNLATGKAVRVIARESSREVAPLYAPGLQNPREAQTIAYRIMPDESLFTVEEVEVQIPPEDRPGGKRRRVLCGRCGEGVNYGREVYVEGCPLCRACGNGAYYQKRQAVRALGGPGQ